MWSYIRDRRACVWVWERPCAAGRTRGAFMASQASSGAAKEPGPRAPAVLSPPLVLGTRLLRGRRGALSRCRSSAPRLLRHEVPNRESFPERTDSSITGGETEAGRHAWGHGEDTRERQLRSVGCAGRSDPAEIKPQMCRSGVWSPTQPRPQNQPQPQQGLRQLLRDGSQQRYPQRAPSSRGGGGRRGVCASSGARLPRRGSRQLATVLTARRTFPWPGGRSARSPHCSRSRPTGPRELRTPLCRWKGPICRSHRGWEPAGCDPVPQFPQLPSGGWEDKSGNAGTGRRELR